MSFENILGPLYIGAMINTLFFWTELAQAWKYFRTYFASDRLFTRSAVILSVFFDVACTIGMHAMIYEDLVKHWGDIVYVSSLNPSGPFLVHATAVGVTSAIVQVFLVIRYWSFSQNRLITSFLSVMLVATISGTIYNLHEQFSFFIYSASHIDFKTFAVGAKIWLTFNIAMDMAVAGCLVIHLVKQDATFKSTKRLVHRLAMMAIKSGSITALYTIAIFISYLWATETLITIGLAFSLGRLYTLTMLYNLNTRQDLRDQRDTIVNGTSWSRQCDGLDCSDPLSSLPSSKISPSLGHISDNTHAESNGVELLSQA